jgi:hypothetical protein
LQLLTIEDLLTGKGIDRPPAQTTTVQAGAGRLRRRSARQVRSILRGKAIRDDY